MKTLVAIAFASVATAQTLVPTAASNDFPACALNCQLLLSAQGGCVPPAAPVTDQAVYVSCFCQSTLISALHTSPDGTCDSYCSVESDRQELMAWYNNLCAAGGAATVVSSTSAVSGPQTTIVYITSTTAPTSTSAPTGSSSSASSSSNGSWYVYSCKRAGTLTNGETGSVHTGSGS
jgi:hypothetical protein